MSRAHGMLMGCRFVRIPAAFSVIAMVSISGALCVCAPAAAQESAPALEPAALRAPAAAQEPVAAQETPRKSAKPQPPNEEYLQKVIKWNPWFLAAASGDTKTIQDYLTSGTQINARDTFGRTALYIATAYEHADIVRLLLKAGADPNLPSEILSHWSGSRAKQSTIHTALEMATESESKEIESLLAQAGAKMQAPASAPRRTDGLTPILAAIEEGSTPTLRSLLKEGSFLRERESSQGMSVPQFALWRGREGLYSVLLEQGLGPSGTQEERNTLLEAAIARRRTGDVRRLLDAGASLNSMPGYRISDAIIWGNKELTQVLVDAGAKLSAQLIPMAVQTGNTELLKMLEAHGIGIDAQKANTLLPNAVTSRRKETVEYLLNKGANPNAPQAGGFTLVEKALESVQPDMANLLIQKGAKPVSEERRSFLLNPSSNYTVTTETLFCANLPSTASLTNTVDLSRYTLYQVTRTGTENSWGYSDIQKNRFLVFTGSPDRIPVGSVNRGQSFMDIRNRSIDGEVPKPRWTFVRDDDGKTSHEWIKLHWVEPPKIADVQWCDLQDGTGAYMNEWTSILLVCGNRVRPIFLWSKSLHGRIGPEDMWIGDQAWSWDSKQQILSIRYVSNKSIPEALHGTVRLAIPIGDYDRSNEREPHWTQITDTTWRYRILGEKVEYLDGQKVERVASGFPVLDVAEKYGLTIRKLVGLNPELKGKVFCPGPVVVSTSISPIDKDR